MPFRLKWALSKPRKLGTTQPTGPKVQGEGSGKPGPVVTNSGTIHRPATSYNPGAGQAFDGRAGLSMGPRRRK